MFPAVADGPRPDGGHVGAAARLGHRDGRERLPAADRGQVLLLERPAAGAGNLLAEHRGGEEVGGGAQLVARGEVTPARTRSEYNGTRLGGSSRISGRSGTERIEKAKSGTPVIPKCPIRVVGRGGLEPPTR
jgi:hypothetical protein